jgi:hypothetical protein
LLGVLLTLILLSSSDDRETGREPRVEPAAPAARPVETAPRELVTPGPPAPVPPPAVVEAPVKQEDSEPRNDGRRTGRASSTSKDGDSRKRPPPPPKRPKPTSPDYGI